ncbi:YtxH domain-containing protein [Lactobacillus psittaci]|uniref:Uncharacterized protein n=1 Tax=Lactobacillus psittaci DSM 15354 TaxID=1122152 RepID=A0A0R1S9C2_9LACO|nr:YtxH domain-containing protein [Lactobacillus psittaci]KRL63045.1 hypothetical protein FC23_GL000982 [Lactobacillus psittaci DSM 15354]
MKKLGSFLLGTIVGATAGLVAASYLLDDETVEDLKKKVTDKVNNVTEKVADNDTLQDLKKRYDNSTEIVKNQLSAFPNPVEDDSELKDFDDIVIDSTKTSLGSDEKNDQKTLSELDHAE